MMADKNNLAEIRKAVVSGIRDYFRKNGFKTAVIGLSGGIDSSVAARLAADSLGKRNVTAVLMPERGVTSRKNFEDSIEISKQFGISYFVVPINGFMKELESVYSNKNPKIISSQYALANAKARARMCILYYFANSKKSLVLGTSDKSEIALGYTTKYGDSASDIMIIGDLWKTEVMEIGKVLGIPSKIILKKPSAELILNVDAEKELGADYRTIDSILRLYIEEKLPLPEIIKKGFDSALVKSILERIRLNEHKRKIPPIIRVSERSFHSTEWRMPITNKFL